MCNIPAESTHLDRVGRRSGCGRALTLWRSALARALDRRAKLLRIGVAARRDDVLHRGFQVAPDGFAYREFTFNATVPAGARAGPGGLGPHAGEDRLREGAFTAGLHRFRSAPETPFDMVPEARPRGGGMRCVVDRRAQPSENNGTLLGVGPTASPARAKEVCARQRPCASTSSARTGDRRHAPWRCCLPGGHQAALLQRSRDVGKLLRQNSIAPRSSSCRPRIHDLRNRFAVSSLRAAPELLALITGPFSRTLSARASAATKV
jgi:hypothetical protein